MDFFWHKNWIEIKITNPFFTMRNLDQYPRVNHNTKLYFQLGLIASLVAVYFVIELKTPISEYEVDSKKEIVDISEKPFQENFRVEKEIKEVVEKAKMDKAPSKKILNKFKEVPNTTIEPIQTDVTSPDDVEKLLLKPIETTPVVLIPTENKIIDRWALEEVPAFKACAELKGPARETCFNEQMANFLISNLEYPEQAHDKGIQESIIVEFIINTDGSVTDVKPAFAENVKSKELEKEALRVIKKLPKLEPGKQAGQPVRVRYTVPITFKIKN